MRQTAIKPGEILLASPDCDRCGAGARLFGIELHPTIDRTELHTYVCERCDALQTKIVPLQS
jgi:hypothetical protein